jgi:2-oxoglutarate dehydrogenase E2 component (dihydrolipoamide succinyltransferase)
MILEVKVPVPGESISEVELGTWLVKSGDIVEMDAELVEINSDKATLTINAEGAGKIEILKGEGEVVRVGDIVARIDTSAAAGDKKPATPATTTANTTANTTAPATSKEGYAQGLPSVSADKLMKDKGVAEGSVTGSGRDGRVTKADVVEHLKNQGSAPAAEAKPESKPKADPPKTVTPPAAKPAAGSRGEERKRMTPLRRKIAERLVGAKNNTAMLTTFNEVDMHAIMDLRNRYKDKFKEKYGIGLGFMGFFVKACSEALRQFPAVNAYIDGDDMVFHDYVDMGIAVSSERGLVVPILRNTEGMSLLEVESAIRDYALKARDNKLSIDEMTGGTFTITNGGVFGSMLSTPILNPPQSAILGMHNIVERPVAINGEVKIRPIMYVALSYDHRIIDGKEAVSFLVRVKEYLEDPARLLLGI